MTKFDDLPDDILRLISKERLKPIHSRKYRIRLWRKILPILSVCRRWRRIAKGIVYAHALIDVGTFAHQLDDSWDFECEQIEPSNIELIEKNGAQHMVQRLCVIAPESEGSLHCLLSIANAFHVDFSKYPELERLSRCYTLDDNGDFVGQSYHPEYLLVAKEIAGDISRRYPNVNSLDSIATEFSHEQHGHFVDMLVDTYTTQITQVRCFVHGYFPKLTSATQLQFLKVSGDSAYNSNAIPVAPGVLRCLWLQGNEFDFTWNDLRHDEEADIVRFDYLNTLVIENKAGYHHRMARFNFGFEFPQLTSLRLHWVKLTTKIATCLMRSPLRQLDFAGLPRDALLLCNLNTGSLERLALSIDCDMLDVPGDERVPLIRELFDHMQNIPEVWCDIRIGNYYLDITDYDFSHYTNLELHASIDVDLFIKKLPTMQKLVRFFLDFRDFNEERVAKANAAILQLKETHGMPILEHIYRAEIRLSGEKKTEGFLHSELSMLIPPLRVTWYNRDSYDFHTGDWLYESDRSL